MKISIILLSLVFCAAKASPQLLPFQGHLTDASGSAIADGAKVVQFKIYDAPVSGTPVWAGEIHKLSVNGGLVNTILGTKTSLSDVDFAESLYLELTVDADDSETITAADPPLLPRQVLLPAVFASEAGEARELDGYDWASVFTTGDPSTGKLKPEIVAANTIPANAIVANNSIQSSQIASNAINTAELRNGAVTGAKIADGTIEMQDLAAELVRQLLPPGTIQAYAGTTPPDGWLMCDGSIVTQAEFPHLWQAIGSFHGAGSPDDGDFHLPDYRGRFLRGTDDPDGPEGAEYVAAGNDPDVSDSERPAMNLGGNQGNRIGSVQDDEFESHEHELANANASGLGQGALARSNVSVSAPGAINTSRCYRVGGSETRPKNVYVNFIIKY
ncbi:tail fiber protein [Roseibacillus ishigakijimensis]|uniref:Tail fiber protein n=1 Tax=Roseibacillus ishigakijimensis TaxID=454146 RepID=A0A934RNI0_9BACT|nr:tail fiber protein [Roseibacillus ishigakijimensis]MBK1835057.1 tail fiber protein [Roseibacillus ishigakijimensis]